MINKALGKRIAKLRQTKDFSQEQLAEMAGYSIEFISLVERGVNAPSVAGLERIAKALDVEIKDLFDFQEEEQRGRN
ncbi:MAG: helix-turn-helix transcriptional regulator [Armatimonadetes bacterium]|nr:helix-turn-helix transcriptional regulator [Armatimonadota bacterium]